VKRRRKTRELKLVLVPILLAVSGCVYDPNDDAGNQRDVYTKFEDCVADWGKPELCQQIADAEAKQFAQSTGASTGGGGHVIYWGPTYSPYGGGRSVVYNGQTYTPSVNRAMSKPFVISPTSSNIARSSPASPVRAAASSSTLRGGFGGGGRAAGVASGGT
jgi:uncharacterized protein YgiB involved in biofilm formation